MSKSIAMPSRKSITLVADDDKKADLHEEQRGDAAAGRAAETVPGR